jgi:hypothetical protein
MMLEVKLSERLNQNCFCRRTNQDSLRSVLANGAEGALLLSLMADRAGLLSDTAVYLPRAAIDLMEATAQAIENVAQLPAYRTRVQARSPEIARFEPGPSGVLMGYDFHVAEDVPHLIEINTNAGGAFINAALAEAQRECCTAASNSATPPLRDGFGPMVIKMFQSEWTKQGRLRPLHQVAIVDDDPLGQYLYPDMLLAQRLLQYHGFEAVIAAADELIYADGVLSHKGRAIDLIYNRLTDFSLVQPEHATLRNAYLDGAVVLTPNPFSHALMADKRNLTILSDETQLQLLGAREEDIAVLRATIPHTVAVNDKNAANLWTERRNYFFKPAAGFGSKAAYRGDKMTKSVWGAILAGDYVAQAYMPPGARRIKVEGTTINLKTDIRLYRYLGLTLLYAARLYQGQTTNFRTSGGGFAPVFLAD